MALPLGLDMLLRRLRCGFYRQPDALAGDLATLAANAAEFTGQGGELAEDAAALAAFVGEVLAGRVSSVLLLWFKRERWAL